MFGVIPPFASGIYGGISCCCFINLSPNIGGGLFINNDGILLILLGLFSANNLSANVPCFYPLESFLTAY